MQKKWRLRLTLETRKRNVLSLEVKTRTVEVRLLQSVERKRQWIGSLRKAKARALVAPGNTVDSTQPVMTRWFPRLDTIEE